MNITLIPFLLAANVLVDNKEPHDMEWTFKHKVTIETLGDNNQESFMETATVKCRSKDTTAIVCVSTWDNEKMKKDSIGIFKFKFDERGVTNAAVKKTTEPAQLLHLKKLASLMSIDADLAGRHIFTAGECDTNFGVFLAIPQLFSEDSGPENVPYIVQPLLHLSEWNTYASVGISKITNPETCPTITNYLDHMFTNHVNVTLYQSMIRIAGPTVFDSGRSVEGYFLNKEEKQIDIRERLKLELLSVEEAKEDFPSLSAEEMTVIPYRTSEDTFLLHERAFS